MLKDHLPEKMGVRRGWRCRRHVPAPAGNDITCRDIVPAGVVYPDTVEVEGKDDGSICNTDNAKPPLPPPPSPPCSKYADGKCVEVVTAFGKLSTEPGAFIQTIYGILLSFSGAIAILLLMRAGYRIQTSRGNPEALKEGQEQVTATIVGLFFLIFAFVLLQVITSDLLRIPGITP